VGFKVSGANMNVELNLRVSLSRTGETLTISTLALSDYCCICNEDLNCDSLQWCCEGNNRVSGRDQTFRRTNGIVAKEKVGDGIRRARKRIFGNTTVDGAAKSRVFGVAFIEECGLYRGMRWIESGAILWFGGYFENFCPDYRQAGVIGCG